MPIRPDQLHRYPPDWDRIAYAAKVRAGWRCVCLGECGRVNGHLEPLDGRCRNRQGMPAYGSGALVILQAGHRNHTPEDVRPENIAAWCPGCHLAHDRPRQVAEARARALAELGMVPLFDAADLVGASAG